MDTAIKLKLAKRLRQLRQKYGYTQEKLAELSGVDYKHIQLLESSNPSTAKLDTIEKLAKAFKITPSKLLDFKK
ncbi:MAG: helix-turn-helix transcriptional regulator [Candidatus Omnitrophica bacterium]|nr:helix-turn-helix transcriptional regulator [Candidatus Omnitrophota bacterium]